MNQESSSITAILKKIDLPQLEWDSCSLVSCLYLHYLLSACCISSVVHPGKDVCSFHPRQLGQAYEIHASRGVPGPFSKLQPAPVNYKAEAPFHPDFDNSALRNSVPFPKITKTTTSHCHSQTSYEPAFDLPYFNTSNPCWFSC
ncbi:uncharacterized protein C1orf100 homolog [Pezoporus wallicus]|uniref:uncharacterized protein C1orf100 homolog n=1 Tax=Pezoporus wallicus TaxID=35540 RepID=UPI002551A781|nr:uncharacterized protein C1orf100 homolog [Pezoporus wallicus]